MSKDLISLFVSVIASIAAVISTLYQYPIVGLILFALGIVGYLAYVCVVTYRNVPGNTFLRLLPVLVLGAMGATLYLFWPSNLKVVLYEDVNRSGYRDGGEIGIQSVQFTLFDVNRSARELVTNAAGEFIAQNMPRGPFSLQMRDFVVEGQILRGDNWIYVGFLPQQDTTRPQTRIFLGDELGYPVTETYAKRIYAHLWFQDAESGIAGVDIDWGEGRGWEKVDLDLPTMRYHIYMNEYKSSGNKTVKFRAHNSRNLSSFPEKEPPRHGYDYYVVRIENPTK